VHEAPHRKQKCGSAYETKMWLLLLITELVTAPVRKFLKSI
jgi:hypothetical protein